MGPGHGTVALLGARHHTEIVAEFFSFGINSILDQRDIRIRPSETFTPVQKYGLTLLVTADPEVMKYLNNVVKQPKDWLHKCSVQKPVVVIHLKYCEVLERWQFGIKCDKKSKRTVLPEKSLRKLSKMKY